MYVNKRKKINCFAFKDKHRENNCIVLSGHAYGDCSFFKTKEQYKADLEEYPPRGHYTETFIPLLIR